MSTSGESRNLERGIRDVEQFLQEDCMSSDLKSIRSDIDTTFIRDGQLATIVPIDDEYGARIETILGGIAPVNANVTEYTMDITLVRSEFVGRVVTSLVAKNRRQPEIEHYVISESELALAAIPHHKLNDTAYGRVAFWMSRRPPITVWSEADSVRLAEDWNRLRTR